VSDIFLEVDEEVRRDQIKKLWERYSGLIVLFAVLIVAGVGGWRGYQWWQAKQAAEAGAAFTAALVLGEQGKHEEAGTAFAKIAKEGTASYRSLAALREATELAQRDPTAAVAAYDTLAGNSSFGPVLQDEAALRAGYILVDTASYDEIRRRIEPLTGLDRTFRHSARGLLALSAWRTNDMSAARRWLQTILGDVETPATTRSQAEMLMTMIGGDGKS
jgi:hypothetical protein